MTDASAKTNTLLVAGQGVVQFATLTSNSNLKYAIKFFLSKAEFDSESMYYCAEQYRNILPPPDNLESNEDGRHVDHTGRCVLQPVLPF